MGTLWCGALVVGSAEVLHSAEQFKYLKEVVLGVLLKDAVLLIVQSS